MLLISTPYSYVSAREQKTSSPLDQHHRNGYVDLCVTNDDISTTVSNPSINQSIVIYAYIHNYGISTAYNVSVVFKYRYSNEQWLTAGYDNKTEIHGNTTVIAAVEYTPTEAGTCTILVCVDEENMIPETNETNNNGTMTIEVSQSQSTNIPPNCEIIYPEEGDYISGIAIVNGSAFDPPTDNNDIVAVYVNIDGGEEHRAEGTNLWEFRFDTRDYPNGKHTIYARSYDGIDYSPYVMVNVTFKNNLYPPTIVISAPANGSEFSTDEDIFFDASASYDKDGDEITIGWDFDDRNGIGLEVEGDRVHHMYKEKGEYNVTVMASDGLYITTKVLKIYINNYAPKPIINIENIDSNTIKGGEEIIFNATGSYDPDGVIVEYHWDFGDGTTANGLRVSHVYASGVATYTVSLRVRDDYGAVAYNTLQIYVDNMPPVANLDVSQTHVSVGVDVEFDASQSYDPDGNIEKYYFDFGDGTTSGWISVDRIYHAYMEEGVYTPRLMVKDDIGTISQWYYLPMQITVEYRENTAPRVRILEPEANTTLYGEITIKVVVEDDDGNTITAVDFRVDSGQWNPMTMDVESEIWYGDLYTDLWEDGTHYITVRGFDGTDYGYSCVQVYFDNSPPIGLSIDAAPDKSYYGPGEEIHIQGTVHYEKWKTPVENASIAIELQGFVYYTTTNNYGEFSITISAPDKRGEYRINITALDRDFNITGAKIITILIKTSSIYLEKWDLDIFHSDGTIVSAAAPPVDGDLLIIKITVRNRGDLNANVTIGVYDGDFKSNGTLIGKANTYIGVNATSEVKVTWIAKGGKHFIYATVLECEPKDEDESDNTVSMSIEVRYRCDLMINEVNILSETIVSRGHVSISISIINLGQISASAKLEIHVIYSQTYVNITDLNENSLTKIIEIPSMAPGKMYADTVDIELGPKEGSAIIAVRIVDVMPYETDETNNFITTDIYIHGKDVVQESPQQDTNIRAIYTLMALISIFVLLSVYLLMRQRVTKQIDNRKESEK